MPLTYHTPRFSGCRRPWNVGLPHFFGEHGSERDVYDGAWKVVPKYATPRVSNTRDGAGPTKVPASGCLWTQRRAGEFSRSLTRASLWWLRRIRTAIGTMDKCLGCLGEVREECFELSLSHNT